MVLITGGTGSFGSTVTRQLLAGDVGEVRILSRDEAKQDDLRRWLSDARARFYVGDVRDSKSVARTRWLASTMSSMPQRSSRCPPASSSRCRRWRTNVQGSDNVISAATSAA